MTKLIRHVVGEEWLMSPGCARVRNVALAEGAEIFGSKFGQHARVRSRFRSGQGRLTGVRSLPADFKHDTLEFGEFARTFDLRVGGEDSAQLV